MSFLEAFSILSELAQCIGEPVALPFEISETIPAGGESGNGAQKILSLLGGLLFGVGTALMVASL